MIYSVKRPYKILFAVSMIMVVGIILIEYTGLLKLEEINLEGDDLFSQNDTPEMVAGMNLFAAPLDKMADRLLNRKKVFRIDVDYQLPNGINLNVNSVKPKAMIIDNNGRTKYYLTESCHLLPINEISEHLDFPLITGLSDCCVYERVRDDRLQIILTQLDALKKDCSDFYFALAAMDLSDKEIVRINIEGLPFDVETYAGTVYQAIRTLEAFLMEYNPDLREIKKLDMRLEGMIIAAS